MATNKTVILKGVGVSEEKEAVAAITPGDLIELTSADKFQRHSSAGGNAQRCFAMEDELQGKEISDDYSADDIVLARTMSNGDRVNALLTTSQTVVIGDKLESNGDGKLRKYVRNSSSGVDEAETIVAIAREAVTTTGAVARIDSEII